MTDLTPAQAPKPQRRTLLLLVGLFFVPLLSAFALYYGTGWRPPSGTNHGELLQPLKQLPTAADELRDKWALVYVGNGACADEVCRHALWTGRQTRLSLNQEMTRVNRVLFATDACCDRAFLDQQHEGIKVFDVTQPAARTELLAQLPPGDLSPYLFIVDPQGNIVMRFDTRENPRGLLDDLKKLLKLSHIG